MVATCRDPESCTDLKQLKNEHREALELVQLDVTDDASIAVRKHHLLHLVLCRASDLIQCRLQLIK